MAHIEQDLVSALEDLLNDIADDIIESWHRGDLANTRSYAEAILNLVGLRGAA